MGEGLNGKQVAGYEWRKDGGVLWLFRNGVSQGWLTADLHWCTSYARSAILTEDLTPPEVILIIADKIKELAKERSVNRQPTKMPEWMERQFDSAERTVETWSDGKCEVAGIPRPPKAPEPTVEDLIDQLSQQGWYQIGFHYSTCGNVAAEATHRTLRDVNQHGFTTSLATEYHPTRLDAMKELCEAVEARLRREDNAQQ